MCWRRDCPSVTVPQDIRTSYSLELLTTHTISHSRLIIPTMKTRTFSALFTLATCALAAPTPDSNSLFVDLFTSPSALGRYQRLLVDPATGNLLTGDALRSVTVMDYNTAPPTDPGDAGG